MDLFDVLLQAGVFTSAVVFYLILIRKPTKRKGFYREPGWNYRLKLILALFAVKRWKSKLPLRKISEGPRKDQKLGWDDISVRASASDGSSALLRIRKLCGRKNIAEVVIYLQLQDGEKYKLPQHPETAISEWVNTQDGWSAGGLKIQILESQTNLRITYNGLLTRVHDNVTQHVKFNLIWASATSAVRHPEDWSAQLAAGTMALEPWRDGSWPQMLNKCDEGAGSWMQWGALQGRFESFDTNGAVERSEYLRLRGTKERSWSKANKGLRRTVTVTAVASDGTAVQIRALSYYKTFTQCISGSVRFPNFTVKSIASTDLILSDFCEANTEIPNTYTIVVSTSNSRTFKLILRIDKEGARTFSGPPHQQDHVYRTCSVEINGEHGTGILELGYDRLETKSATPTNITPLPVLKFLGEQQTGEVDYCLPFVASAATCPDLVGGKGASLALLASVQDKEPYAHIATVAPLSILTDKLNLPVNKIPGELYPYMRVRDKKFLPIIQHNVLKSRISHLQLLNSSTSEVNVTVSVAPASYGTLRLAIHVRLALEQFHMLGFSDKDIDDVKGIFADTNLYLLSATVLIASCHLLFDFLAFKNDVSFWRRKRSLAGLSARTVFWRAFSQLVIFFYLLDEQTSLLVLVPAGISSIIELWKVTKVLHLRVSFPGWRVWRLRVWRERDSDAGEKSTARADAEAMRYLSILLYPLCIAGAVYSLLYVAHKSWYSWALNSVVNGVYAFGFLFMLPQLFVNYRLRSVAALPWRAFMYKAFNTFIDDVFAFIITMPTAHRVACFRDDLVFLVYLYQRWLYPVDKSRMDTASSMDENPEEVEPIKKKEE